VGAVAKPRERTFYAALQLWLGNIATSRVNPPPLAVPTLGPDASQKLIIRKVSHGARRKLCWRDDRGRTGSCRWRRSVPRPCIVL
jgi:hypothetical protein